MKFLILLCLFMATASFTVMAGSEVGNGGDADEAEFAMMTVSVHRFLREDEGRLFPEVLVTSESINLAETKFLAVTHPLFDRNGRERDALNYRVENRIEFQKAKWSSLSSNAQKVGLVAHELLGLLGIEIDNYSVSSRIGPFVEQIAGMASRISAWKFASYPEPLLFFKSNLKRCANGNLKTGTLAYPYDLIGKKFRFILPELSAFYSMDGNCEGRFQIQPSKPMYSEISNSLDATVYKKETKSSIIISDKDQSLQLVYGSWKFPIPLQREVFHAEGVSFDKNHQIIFADLSVDFSQFYLIGGKKVLPYNIWFYPGTAQPSQIEIGYASDKLLPVQDRLLNFYEFIYLSTDDAIIGGHLGTQNFWIDPLNGKKYSLFYKKVKISDSGVMQNVHLTEPTDGLLGGLRVLQPSNPKDSDLAIQKFCDKKGLRFTKNASQFKSSEILFTGSQSFYDSITDRVVRSTSGSETILENINCGFSIDIPLDQVVIIPD